MVGGDPDYRLVALRPVIAYALEKLDIACTIPQQYGDWEERFQIGLDNLNIVSEIAKIFDRDLPCQKENPAVRPGHDSFFYLKILFDVISTKIHLLNAIIENEQPEEVTAFSRSPATATPYFPFSDDESVFAYLLQQPGWHVRTHILPSHSGVNTGQQKTSSMPYFSLKPAFLSFLRNHDFFFNLGIIGKKTGIANMASALVRLCRSRGRGPVIIYNCGYNWDYSLPEFLERDILPVFRMTDKTFSSNISTPDSITCTYNTILTFCKEQASLRQYTLFGSVDASALFFERISSILSHVITDCADRYTQSKLFFEKTQARCLLLSTQAFHGDRAVIRAAADLGMKVISWQHGGSGFCYHPMIVQAEFLDSDIHLVFGEGVKKSHDATCRQAGYHKVPELIVVGSNWFDEEQRKIQQSCTRNHRSCPVLFITSFFNFNLYYNSAPLDSSIICDNLWQVQRQFLDLAGNNRRVNFIFKLHPADFKGEPSREYAADHKLENLKFVVQEYTVADLVSSASIIVIDLVSTSFLQALLSDKPVFIYTGMYRMDERPLALLKKRAFVYDKFEDLCSDIEAFFLEGLQPLLEKHGTDLANTEFIREFATFRHDGKSASRAADILSTVLDG